MTDMSPSSQPNNLYFALWRWHFYAGLIALPFMISLSITGALYLFKDEINSTFFAKRNIVMAAGAMLPPSAIVAKAEAAFPQSHALSFNEPASETSSANVIIATQQDKQIVWLDPYSGQVLDSVPRNREFFTVVKHLHSLDFFGDIANMLIEIVAGFALVLVVTGFYLWWPRGQRGGVMSVRGTAGKRVFWRDIHAVSGAIAGALIFFLAITGMPWSGYWGEKTHALADKAGMGYPQGMWDNVPNSDMHANHMMDKVGWTLSTSPVPQSPSHSGASLNIDDAYKIARGSGMARGFQLNLPKDAEGVFTASVFPDDLSQQRLLHIDQYTGQKLVDVGFKDYGAAAKTIEFGINVHMGQEWGRLNQLLMLLTCFAILLSSVTAAIMWWKRRPQGRLGVPPQPHDKKIYRTLLIVMLIFGCAFPLTGLAILLMLGFDLLLVRHIPLLRKAFS
ncbi:MAG: PepSY domain-containing protein [Pseudomonadota bacterium]